MSTFIQSPTRFLFFTGKGGVGKTALACASAIRLAESGKRILLVSTDPASNLDEMLGVTLGTHPTPVPGVDGLFALNIDPDLAADEYRERVIAPYRGSWSEAQLDELREQLSGACTVEIAAFDEFTTLLGSDEQTSRFDHILFDTAPTGHTLRLLSLPRAWSGFLQQSPSGASCLGPHSGLKMHEARFSAALGALSRPDMTTIVLVTRAERSALREAERTCHELRALGLANQQLVINGLFQAADRADPVARALEQRGAKALSELPSDLSVLPCLRVPLRPFNMVGLPALRALLDDHAAEALARAAPSPALAELPGLSSLIDELAQPGQGLVMVMGKGGVGKTTVAAAIAAELATRGHPVHLSTTDPAAHLATTLAGELPNLTISRIDPAAETKLYVERIMARRGAQLDAAGRALLAEELRSPCYEEVAVFAAFARIVSQARKQLVVLDTAPTGHTLLLLDAAGSYHRQALASEGDAEEASARIVTPLMRLRDPNYTRILLVTLAETTPVSEAARLQEDLRRANIEPYAWVINSSLAAARPSDPCLRQRAASELVQIELVRAQHARRVAVIPWQTEEPVGPARLLALTRAATRAEEPVRQAEPVVDASSAASSSP